MTKSGLPMIDSGQRAPDLIETGSVGESRRDVFWEGLRAVLFGGLEQFCVDQPECLDVT